MHHFDFYCQKTYADKKVLEVNGKTKISDVALANKEWDLNTRSELSKTKAGGRPAGSRNVFSSTPTSVTNTPPAPISLEAFKQRFQQPQVEAEPESEIDPDTGYPRISISRARREHFDAVSAQAKAEAAQGAQVAREEVTRAAFNVARQVRDSLLLIEDRLADQLAAINDPMVIRKMLRDEFREALGKLATEVASGES